MSRSIEEKVEEYYKKEFDNYGIRHFGKTENNKDDIANGLKEADCKCGGGGIN